MFNAEQLFEYDEELMDRVNGLTTEIMDRIQIAKQWMQLRARSAFGEEHIRDVISSMLDGNTNSH
jgi:hypothetical protein